MGNKASVFGKCQQAGWPQRVVKAEPTAQGWPMLATEAFTSHGAHSARRCLSALAPASCPSTPSPNRGPQLRPSRLSTQLDSRAPPPRLCSQLSCQESRYLGERVLGLKTKISTLEAVRQKPHLGVKSRQSPGSRRPVGNSELCDHGSIINLSVLRFPPL